MAAVKIDGFGIVGSLIILAVLLYVAYHAGRGNVRIPGRG